MPTTMKNLFLALFLGCCLSSSFAQSLSFPKEIIYTKEKTNTKKKKQTEEEKRQESFQRLHSFHPIGWSPDGKFAYANFYKSYWGDTRMVIMVQHIATNVLIWDKEFTESGIDEPESNKNIDKTALWAKYAATIEKDLAALGIQQENKIDFRKDNSHVIDGQSYQFLLNIKDDLMQIDCQANGLGKKTILANREVTYDAPNYYIAGIIKSPHENRVLVVSHFLEHGFEFIVDTYVVLAGCELKKGFE